jgi:hypothetical protein
MQPLADPTTTAGEHAGATELRSWASTFCLEEKTMATVRMIGATGDDDLRSDCHAVLRVFLKGSATPLVFDPILGGQADNTTFDVSRNIGNVAHPTDITSFQIEHVSVEQGFETRDNWNMNSVEFQFVSGSLSIIVARSGFHRFTGDSAVLDIPFGRDPAWHGWEDLGGPIKSPPAASSWKTNWLDVFAAWANDNGSLWHKRWDGSNWQNWNKIGGVFQGGPAAVSWGPNRIDLFVLGIDNKLGHRLWNGQWSNWEALSGQPTSAPAVASWQANWLDVFAATAGEQIMHKRWDGASWGDVSPLHGVLKGAPAAVSWGPNRIDLFVRGSDDHLGHNAWSGQWSGWVDLGGPISSAPAVASWGANRLDVFAAGPDGQLIHKSWDGSQWNPWEWVGGVFHDNPAAVSWGPNRIDVFIWGMDNHLGHLWRD